MKQGQQTSKSLLQEDQALVPQTYKKRLESKALLDYYRENSQRRISSEQQKIYQKLRQLQYNNVQSQRHYYEQEKKKLMKELNKYQYAKQYDQMIHLRKQRQNEEKSREIWLEKQLLQDSSWIRNRDQEKKAEQNKKIEYAKQLQRLLKLQEQKRLSEALRFKQLRQGGKKEHEQSQKRDLNQIQKYKSRSGFDKKQAERYSVKDSLYWPIPQDRQRRQPHSQDSRPLTPRMDLMLKMQKKMFYGKGVQAEYKSQNQRKYFGSNPQVNVTLNQQSMRYNPITNPIPYKYKNPVVLKMLNDYS